MTAERGERDKSGKFAKGNKGGPGNPFMRRLAAMRREVAEAFEEGELRPLMTLLRIRALQGDMAAARLVLEYTVGKPGKAVDPDMLDAEDVAIRRRNAITQDDIEALFSSYPARLLCLAAEARAERQWRAE
jgi:hypothetical protein